MPIKPILSTLLRNKAASVLVVLQIALTLAFVSNSVFIAAKEIKRITQPTGLDIDNMFTVFPQGFAANFDIRQALRDDMQTLRNMPGVIDASPVGTIPGIGVGRITSYYADSHAEALNAKASTYTGDEHLLPTLGLKLITGRNFTSEEIEYLNTNDTRDPRNAIISQSLAEKLFPDTHALGKVMWVDGFRSPVNIIGIYEYMLGNAFVEEATDMTVLLPQVIYQTGNDPNYVVRVEPGQVNQLSSQAEELLARMPGRMIWNVWTLHEHRNRIYTTQRVIITMLVTVTILLVLVTALGIVGLTAFSINKRRRQIGTRRALGARKRDILQYFLLENWLITTIGILIGTVLTYVLNMGLVKLFNTDAISFVYVICTIMGLWILGQLAVLIPAKRASGIDPAIATRSV